MGWFGFNGGSTIAANESIGKIVLNTHMVDYKVKKSGTITDTAAPTVTVAPAAGTYTSTQTVAFTVKDNIDTAPKLYYTLDGSAASASSTLYTGPITVSKSTTINTYAVDAAGNKVSSSPRPSGSGRSYRSPARWVASTCRSGSANVMATPSKS